MVPIGEQGTDNSTGDYNASSLQFVGGFFNIPLKLNVRLWQLHVPNDETVYIWQW